MPRLRWLCVSLLLLSSGACGGTSGGTTSPTGSLLVYGDPAYVLDGRVLNSDTAAAVPGATVNVNDGARILGTRTTDVQGRFSFVLDQGRYGVTVTAAGFTTSSRTFTMSANLSDTFMLVPTGCKFGFVAVARGTGFTAIYSNGVPLTFPLRIATIRGGDACEWTSASSVPWATLTPSSGTGDGAATLSIAADSDLFRCGVMFIAGNRVNLLQYPFPLPPNFPALDDHGCDAYWSQYY